MIFLKKSGVVYGVSFGNTCGPNARKIVEKSDFRRPFTCYRFVFHAPCPNLWLFPIGYKFSLIPNSYGAALAAGGAAVVAIVALLAVAAVISPLFGFRLCQLFSTCDLPPASAGQYAASDYPGYSATGTPFGGSGYQKR